MSPKTTALIIDDEQEARELLSALLQKFPEIELVAQASSVDAGIVSFLKHKPDLVFLDIQMPQKDGFEFINLLQNHLIETTIIFVTAYHKFAIEAIRHSAFDFLLKPINQNELSKTINRFHKTNSKNNFQHDIQHLLAKLNEHKKIKLNTRNGFELLKVEEILYLEADASYTKIVNLSGKSTISSLNLKKVEAMLLEYHYFLRISRSNIINTIHLSSFDRKRRKCTIFANSKAYELNVSRDKLKDFDRLL